jgi:hypothetical protein
MNKIQERFNRLQAELSGLLATKREAAALSVPTELPPAAWTPDTELERPLSGEPCKAIGVLIGNLVNATVPSNGTSIFTMKVATDELRPEEAALLNSFEVPVRNAAMDILRSSNLRSVLYDIYRALVVVGDVCVEQVDTQTFAVHRLDNFVAHRTKDGKVHELIVREWVDPETMPDKWRGATLTSGVTMGVRRMESLFTSLKRNADGEYDQVVEFRGNTVETGKIKVLNYYPLRARGQPGSDVGVSICEDIIGSLRGLQCAELAQLEGLAANSEFRLMVDPHGITQLSDMELSVNGQWCGGRSADVGVVQLGNPIQVQLTQTAIDKYVRTIQAAMSYGRYYSQTSRDRVTAAEVAVDAKDREGGVSGVLTNIGKELLGPMILRSLFLVRSTTQDPKVWAFIDWVIAHPETVQLNTGVAALNLEIRGMRLGEVVNTLLRMPEPAWQHVKWDAVTAELLNAAGFVGETFVKTPEELQAENQQKMMAQMQATAGNAAAQTVGESVLGTQSIPIQPQ